MNSENHYLYFNGEKTNPFTKEEDYNYNRHMWWHYEYHHFHFERHNEKFLKLEDYIKDVPTISFSLIFEIGYKSKYL